VGAATRSAFVLGATGQIGRAVCARLAEGGWEVVAAARGNRPSLPGTRLVRVDRQRVGALQRAVGDGVDGEIEAEQIDPGLVVSPHAPSVKNANSRGRCHAAELVLDLRLHTFAWTSSPIRAGV
jgi:NAD(P)-dependent dehydrogenase (short-subunit alcohol dehydrogenase family)